MFESARIKLTLWYLVIIMTVSVSFSAIIYRGVAIELERRFNTIQSRLQLRRAIFIPAQPNQQIISFIEDLEDSKKRVVLILGYANIVILVFSAVAGYFLAGKTLRPIESAMKEQKRFVADASHEFKTPLTSLQTSIEVALRDKKLNLKESKTVLKESLNDIQSLTKLSNYLLSLAKFQENNSFPKERVEAAEVVSKSIKRISPLAKKKKIEIKENLEKVAIKSHPESLDKLVTILLDNAIKYTNSSGHITVSLFKTSRSATIEIQDNGIGISKEDLPHIFERFYKGSDGHVANSDVFASYAYKGGDGHVANSDVFTSYAYRASTSRPETNSSGFGLGLSMAKQIVEMHGGEIKVNSRVDKGTTFTVKLPLS